jgi:hypothetical protein
MVKEFLDCIERLGAVVFAKNKTCVVAVRAAKITSF